MSDVRIGQLTFDELNKLVGMKRSEPFEAYFAPMRITEEQKQQRIDLAKRFEDEFLYILAWLFNMYPYVDTAAVDELKNRYMDVLAELGIVSVTAARIAEEAAAGIVQTAGSEYELQASKFAADTVSTTADHKDDPYFYSHDRARLLAEGEANTVYNYKEYEEAVSGGLLLKTWETVGDTHVRETHQEIDGVTIPIDEPFEVGGYYMQYPRDASEGAGAEEIANCRCSLTYSTVGAS